MLTNALIYKTESGAQRNIDDYIEYLNKVNKVNYTYYNNRYTYIPSGSHLVVKKINHQEWNQYIDRLLADEKRKYDLKMSRIEKKRFDFKS